MNRNSSSVKEGSLSPFCRTTEQPPLATSSGSNKNHPVITVDIDNIIFLSKDPDADPDDDEEDETSKALKNKVETYCNILMERAKATASQRRKELVRERKQRQQQQQQARAMSKTSRHLSANLDGSSGGSLMSPGLSKAPSLRDLTSFDDFDLLNSTTTTPFPDPRSVRISFYSLSESVTLCIDLLKRLIQREDQYNEFVEENSLQFSSSATNSLSESKENIPGSFEEADDAVSFDSTTDNNNRMTAAMTFSKHQHPNEALELELVSSKVAISQFRVFVSWVCEITASALRRHLGLRTSDFHASSDEDLLEKEVLLLLVDGNLLARREEALDALVDFREEMQKTIGKVCRHHEKLKLKAQEEKENEGKDSKTTKAKDETAEKDEEGEEDEEEFVDGDDEDLKVLQKAQELAKEKTWQLGTLCTGQDSSPIASSSLASGATTPRLTKACYTFLSPTTTQPPGTAKPSESAAGPFDAALLKKDTENENNNGDDNDSTKNGENDGNNSEDNKDGKKQPQDKDNEKEKEKEKEKDHDHFTINYDEEDVCDWSDGLGYLAPFITATWKDLEKTKKGGSSSPNRPSSPNKQSESSGAASAAAAIDELTATSSSSLSASSSWILRQATDYEILQKKLPSILFFEQELSRRQKIIQSASTASFTHYWLKGLRQHLFHSVVAFTASACVAGVSTPVVQMQQRLERKLDPATQQHDEDEDASEQLQKQQSSGEDDEEGTKNGNNTKKLSEESLKDWTLTSVNLLASLVILKTFLNVLLGVISSTLARVAASHRDEEKRRLTFAWTKMPLSTIHTLSSDRIRQITCFPNDLEGLSVSLQRDIVSFGRAVVRCGAALGAVAMTSEALSSSSSGSSSSSSSSSSNNNKPFQLIPSISAPPRFIGNNFFTRSITNSLDWVLGTFINTPVGWGHALFTGVRSFTSTSVNFIRLLKSSQNGKEAMTIMSNHTSMLGRALVESPRMRVVMFVSLITGATAAGSWLFQKIKSSKAVKNFLKTKPDSESVATGGDLYTALRRKGKVLLAPAEIVELMSPLLRLQHHADSHLMKLWYDAVSHATSTFDDRGPAQHHHHHHHHHHSKLRAMFSVVYHSFASNFLNLAQSSLKSVFSTISDLSDWVVPLAAAAVYHRVLSKGLVSRFLILECLHSASAVVSSGHNLKETWETIEMQSYKALIVSCMIRQNSNSLDESSGAGETSTNNNGSPHQEGPRRNRNSIVNVLAKKSMSRKDRDQLSNMGAEAIAALNNDDEEEGDEEEEDENNSNNNNNKQVVIKDDSNASHLRIKDENSIDAATNAIVDFIQEAQQQSPDQLARTFSSGYDGTKRLSLVVVDQDVNTYHQNKKGKKLLPQVTSYTSPRTDDGLMSQTANDEELFTFAYPARPNRTVLTLVPRKFEVPLSYRSIVAITGKSGSGKTTLLKLMLREYEAINRYRETTATSNAGSSGLGSALKQKALLPTTLGIRLTIREERQENADGTVTEAKTTAHDSPLHNFAPEFLRSSLFSFVPQQCALLPGSFNVAENISLQPCALSDNSPRNLELVARVRNAAQLANAMDIVAGLPEGLFTIVAPATAGAKGGGGGDGDGDKGGGGGGSSSENVIQLSGGQIQRIGIARALFQGSPVLLMDEPTASLDPTTKKELLATLRKLVNENPVAQPSGCFELKNTSMTRHPNNNVNSPDNDMSPNDDDVTSDTSPPSPIGTNGTTSPGSPNDFDYGSPFSDSSDALKDMNNQMFNFPHPRCVVYVTHDSDAVKEADVVVDLSEQKKNIV